MRLISFDFKRMRVFFAVAVFLSGCDKTIEFKNTPPGSLEIEKDICYLATGKTITLCGSGEDPDGDPVTYRWTSPYGTFVPASGEGQCVGWVAPQTAGIYPVTLIATDEIVESSKTEELVVGQSLALLPGDNEIEDNGSFYMIASLVPQQVGFRTTLTINSGVTIIILNTYGGFTVEGNLNILGTPAHPVTMKSEACPGAAGKWGGISFRGDDAIGAIRHLKIYDAEIGISVADQARVTIDTCTVMNCDEAITITDSSEVDITGCKIWENDAGVKSFYSNTTIRTSSIRYNGLYGMWIGGAAGAYKTDIQYSNISNNTVYGGFRLSGYAIPVVKNCAIFLNIYGFYPSEYFGAGVLDFTMNYWGLTDGAAISQYILDGEDTMVDVYVDFDPWLNSSPADD